MDLIKMLESRLALAKQIQSERGGFCTYKEAAILLGLDTSSTRFYAYRGIIEKTKIGKNVFIHLDEVAKVYQGREEKKIETLKQQLKALGV